jgi:hypothetical protein
MCALCAVRVQSIKRFAFTAGTPPDRTDPKVAAAMQACISTLGAAAPGAGGAPAAGGGGGRAARPTPTATP